jgi:phosphoribosylformimino-5-aminoimidazole carboxamide ribotide isomerase
MRLIPVLDVQHGKVVRGIGGRRSEYRLLVSVLTTSVEPVAVAETLVGLFALSELYVADLDAIAGRQPSWPALVATADLRQRLWVDAGIRSIRQCTELSDAKIGGIVIGMETVNGPEVLDAAVNELGAGRIVFSLDLRGGRLLGQWTNWHVRDDRDWPTVVERVVRAGVKRLILLDLASVGEGRGTGTEAMCQTIAAQHPDLEIICGGGVRDVADLRRLVGCGASAALVASALHDGRIKPGDWPPAL